MSKKIGIRNSAKSSGAKGGHWIQGAIVHPGSFTAAAHRAGESVAEYANRKDLSPLEAKRSALYHALQSFHHK